MNFFDTFIFPETNIFYEKYYPLLLFFSPLYFLQLAEPGAESDINNEAALLVESDLCRPHIPTPLGDNRDRFLRLISDIKEQRGSYVDQLNALIINATDAQKGDDAADLKHKIGTILLEKLGADHEISETELDLWQDRLVLFLAEILDRREDDLQEDLSFFNEEEIAAFHSLHETTDNSAGDLISEIEKIKTKLAGHRLGNNIMRFKAWLRLLKNRPVPRVKVWLASTRDSADQVFSRHEAAGNGCAVPVLKLALPAHIEASAQYVVQRVKAFHHKATRIHQGLVADFARMVTTVPYLGDCQKSLLPYKTDWADLWAEMLDEYFPASHDGRIGITFYLLPNRPIARLLALPESPDGTQDQTAHGLLAVLGSAKPA